MLEVLLRKMEQKKLHILTQVSQVETISLVQFSDDLNLSRPTVERQVLSLIDDLNHLYGEDQSFIKISDGVIFSTIDIHTTKHNPTRVLINSYLGSSSHYHLLDKLVQEKSQTTELLVKELETSLPYIKKMITELNKQLNEFQLNITLKGNLIKLDGPILNRIMFTYLFHFIMSDTEHDMTQSFLTDQVFNDLDATNKYRASALSKTIELFTDDLQRDINCPPTTAELITELFKAHPLVDTIKLKKAVSENCVPFLNFLFIQVINNDSNFLSNNGLLTNNLTDHITTSQHEVVLLSSELLQRFGQAYTVTWNKDILPFIETGIVLHILTVQVHGLNIISRFFRSIKFQYGYRVDSEFSKSVLTFVKTQQVESKLTPETYFPDIPKAIMLALVLTYQFRTLLPVSIAVSISTNNMAESLIRKKISQFINPDAYQFSTNHETADLIIADHFLSSLMDKESLIISDITNHNVWSDITSKISYVYSKKNKLTL
ncbi:helix-turn-helix domain-containing protein [Vagococcus coleopterorum]|nr:helix-turn-helix domain-containing protein [Vagococcus coleopterorum]